MSKKDLTKPGKIKKSKYPGALSQEARDPPGILKATIFGHGWPPFIITYKTKIDVSVKVALS